MTQAGHALANEPWFAIVNPAAGRLRRSRGWIAMERALRVAGVPLDVVTTGTPGAGLHLAMRARRAGRTRFLVAGGDGSVHDVVNGLMEARSTLPAATPPPLLATVPMGTANDWCRSLNITGEPTRVAQAVRQERTLEHDVGEITFDRAADAARACWFVNVAGAGFDAHVIARLPAPTPSGLAYLVGALRELGRYRSPQFRVSRDTTETSGRLLLAFVANGRYCGHRMQVAPGASPDDGRFDVVTIDDVGLWRAVPKLAKLYRGTLLGDPLVRHGASTRVRIEADPPAPVEADGQLVGTTPATFTIVPRALRVVHDLPGRC